MKYNLANEKHKSELEIIAKYFKPLSSEFEGADNLQDDGLIITNMKSSFAVTTDNLIEDVHFPSDTSGDLVCARAIYRSLSDLAAMGSLPHCWLCNLTMTSNKPENFYKTWFESFYSQAKALNDKFNWHLAGGDFSCYPGKIQVAITAIGLNDNQTLRRSNAKEGFVLAIAGSLGESNLALSQVIKKSSDNIFNQDELETLRQAYYFPKINIKLGLFLANLARETNKKIAAIDISDGLILDAARIALASNVDIKIHLDKLPLSKLTKKWLDKTKDFSPIIAGGDDYSLLFALEKNQFNIVKKSYDITKIGEIIAGSGQVEVIAENIFDESRYLLPKKLGYLHRFNLS